MEQISSLSVFRSISRTSIADQITPTSLLNEIFYQFMVLLKPVIQYYNRLRAKKSWVLILGEVRYCRDLVERSNALGYKVMLFDPTPMSMHWRFASSSKICDFDDPNIVNDIVETACFLGCPVVMMQSIDVRLPLYAEVNSQLRNDVRFTSKAIQSSLDKFAMREFLMKAGMSVPVWKAIEDQREFECLPFPAVIKPKVGQGSRGISYVKNAHEAACAKLVIEKEFGQEDCLYEEYLAGRQYNIDGVIKDTVPYFHMITEECYTDFLPEFVPCWYLFGVTPNENIEAEIIREARSCLAACDFNSGAFHLEVIFKKNRAYSIDLSNRMPSDFVKYARYVMGFDPVEEYIDIMHGRSVTQRSLSPQSGCPILQYYNFNERLAHREIRNAAYSLANDGIVTISEKNSILELCGKETELRRFLDYTYDCAN